MEWIYIIGFVLLGLVFMAVEVLFIPGTTLVGILGGLITFIGIFIAYKDHGFMFGSYTLLGAMVGAGVLTWVSVKMLKSYAVDAVIDGQVNEPQIALNVGDKGVSSSVLRPMGSVRFGDKKIEVESRSGMIEEGEEVEVIKIDDHKIYVKKK